MMAYRVGEGKSFFIMTSQCRVAIFDCRPLARLALHFGSREAGCLGHCIMGPALNLRIQMDGQCLSVYLLKCTDGL